MSDIKEIIMAEKARISCPECEAQLSTIWIGPLGLLSMLVQTAYHTLGHQSETLAGPEESEQ